MNTNQIYTANLPAAGRAYGLDLDANLEFDPRHDAVLAFDLAGDGIVSELDVELSGQALRALGGDYDLDQDGQLSFDEGIIGSRMHSAAQSWDRDHDGLLSAEELKRARARVLVDGRVYSPEAFPLPDGTTGSLARVDPRYHCSWVASDR
ncbi:hypothetical protein DYH09_05235 [bacterium CPR1]|nr:hypothetical protein [bacterium CPR1]